MIKPIAAISLFSTILPLAFQYSQQEDPWVRLQIDRELPPHILGSGSRHDFRWYFEGETAIQAASVDEICKWLIQCNYVSDPDLFHEIDFWQHPKTFEQGMKGDCEDHALWAWRKLSELGFETEFFVGYVPGESYGESHGHAWVMFRGQGQDYLLEATAKVREHMVFPFNEVKDSYIPHWSIDQCFQVHCYGGLLRSYIANSKTAK